MNPVLSAVDLLATRRSVKPQDLVAPGPAPCELDRILTLASRVPDHGKLVPWRFVVVQDRGRFAELLVTAWQEGETVGKRPASEAQVREFAHQAPALIALLHVPNRATSIPADEQHLTVGAVGMALLCATQALGYAGCWITGWAARSEPVRMALADCAGMPEASIAGFFFLGSPRIPPQERPRPSLLDIRTRF